MDDPALVQCCEALENVTKDFQCSVQRQDAEFGETRILNDWQGEVGQLELFVASEVEDRQQVRVLEATQELPLGTSAAEFQPGFGLGLHDEERDRGGFQLAG